MERIYKATTGYIKSISKRSEGDDKERTLPIARLGSAMVSHGEDFDKDSQFGQTLTCEFDEIVAFRGLSLLNADCCICSMRPGARAACSDAGKLRDAGNLQLA